MSEISNLVPEVQVQRLDYDTWSQHTPCQGFELWNGIPFFEDGIDRDRLTICCIHSMGLQHLLKLLPQKSKEILKDLLEEDMYKKED
jgi:hypothetical protein